MKTLEIEAIDKSKKKHWKDGLTFLDLVKSIPEKHYQIIMTMTFRHRYSDLASYNNLGSQIYNYLETIAQATCDNFQFPERFGGIGKGVPSNRRKLKVALTFESQAEDGTRFLHVHATIGSPERFEENRMPDGFEDPTDIIPFFIQNIEKYLPQCEFKLHKEILPVIQNTKNKVNFFIERYDRDNPNTWMPYIHKAGNRSKYYFSPQFRRMIQETIQLVDRINSGEIDVFDLPNGIFFYIKHLLDPEIIFGVEVGVSKGGIL